MKRFADKEEMLPLINLIREGKLFAVQEWIEAGKPVNPPRPEPKKRRWAGPLEEAIDTGFHSMVHVLLEGGANLTEPHNYEYGEFCALCKAIGHKRMDLIELLVEHGTDPSKADMNQVFDSWDPEIMRYFIERGADVVTDNPLAFAFEMKIRTALGVYKQYESRFPDWHRQINIALRHHTKEENQKWVSLLLWAGADPYDIGPSDSEEYENDWPHESALEIALWRRWEWMTKKIENFTPSAKDADNLLTGACYGGNLEALTRLIEAGTLQLASDTNKSELVGSMMRRAAYCQHEDNTKFALLSALLAAGAKWLPDQETVRYTRRAMVGGKATGFSETVALLRKHEAATKDVLRELTRTGKAQALLYSGTADRKNTSRKTYKKHPKNCR